MICTPPYYSRLFFSWGRGGQETLFQNPRLALEQLCGGQIYYRFQGLGFRVQGLGFTVSGFRV